MSGEVTLFVVASEALERLHALAEEAQRIEPGPWRVEEDGHDGAEGWVFPHGAFTRSREVNEYMAAASPDALLALLAEVARLEQERDEARKRLAALTASSFGASPLAAEFNRMEADLAAARAREQHLRDLLGACVEVGFADVPGYAACRGCLSAYEQAGEWWDEEVSKRMTHDEDCPLYPFAVARAALADQPAATTDDFLRYCCGKPDCPNDCERDPLPASAAADEGAPGETWFNMASAAADEPGERE